MTDNNYVPPPVVPQRAMSRDTTIHYSFDMAQQVSYKKIILLLTFNFCRFTIQVIPCSLGQCTF